MVSDKPNGPSTEGHDVDALTEELLGLVDQYERAVNGGLRDSFIDGFVNLSRANFNNASNYGPKDFDLSGNRACKNVRCGSTFELVDLLEQQRLKQKQAAKSKTDSDPEKNEAVSSGVDGITIESKTVEVVEDPLKDPIRQFGGIIPYQLTESQKCFNEGLEKAVQAVNIQSRITQIINTLQEQASK